MLGSESSRLRFIPIAASDPLESWPRSAGRLCRLRGISEGGGISLAGFCSPHKVLSKLPELPNDFEFKCL